MHTTRKRLAAFLLVACTAFEGNLAVARAARPDVDALVRDAARAVMRQHDIPGMAIALTVNGKRRFYSYGVASWQTGQKVTRDTLFEIGSISKAFTATLATFARANRHLLPKLGMRDSYINVPASKMSLYAQGYTRENAPVRVNPGLLAAEAYGVKTSAKDLIRFVEANLRPEREEAKLKQAILDTHTGYYKLGSMTQDLIWEQYGYPVELDALLQGSSDQVVYEGNAVTALNPPQPARSAVWIGKTGGTDGFSAYVAFVPAKKLGIAVLANKNYPIEPRIRLAYQVLHEFDCCSSREK